MWLVAVKNRDGKWAVLTGKHARFKRLSEIADILSESSNCKEVHLCQIKSSTIRVTESIDIDLSDW